MDFPEVGLEGGVTRTRLIRLRIGTGRGSSECRNELLGSTKCGEFLN